MMRGDVVSREEMVVAEFDRGEIYEDRSSLGTNGRSSLGTI